MNATELWRVFCVLKTQGVFRNLFLFLTEGGYNHDGLQTRNLDQTPSFEFHKTGVNTMEPWRGVCVLETQGVFCNLFLFRF